jgi:hypothetical protein
MADPGDATGMTIKENNSAGAVYVLGSVTYRTIYT